jgi:ketosteroid isomerase-like protein
MSAKNITLIKKINQAFAEGDSDFFLNCLADDAKWTVISISSIIGKENISKALKTRTLEKLPEITVNDISSEGESVIVKSTGIAESKTGYPYQASYNDVYRLENGKIKEFITYVIETTY